MTLNRRELALLATIDGIGCPTKKEIREVAGRNIDGTLTALLRKGVVQRPWGWYSRFRGRDIVQPQDRYEQQYIVTSEGRHLLQALYRDCDWCGEPAVDGAVINGAASSVYWCDHHARVGQNSATGGKLASKGSLYGQWRSGNIPTREPDEIAA